MLKFSNTDIKPLDPLLNSRTATATTISTVCFHSGRCLGAHLQIIVNRSPPTNCDLDSVPTRLLKEQLDCIIPLMVDIVNKLLCLMCFLIVLNRLL